MTTATMHDLTSEQAVLGAILNAAWAWESEREHADPALAMLEPQDFYRFPHQAIWEAIQNVVAAGNPPTQVFVDDELMRTGRREDALSPAYLVELQDAYWTERFYITNHARVVRTAGLQRRLAEAAQRGDMAGITTANQGLAAMGATNNDDFPTMREAAESYFDMMGDESTRLVRTGLGSLDRVLGGLRPGNLVVIGARPGVGKSAMGLTIAYHVGIRSEVPVGFLSLEMSTYEIMQRLLAMDANVSTTDARNPIGPVADALGRIAEKPLYIRRPGSGVMDVLAFAGPLVANNGCQLIIIDYLQLMSGQGKTDSRPQEIASITREIKNWAQAQEVPVILLSQLKRDTNHKGLPRLEDIADSDAPARDADIVLFLHPEEGSAMNATTPTDLLIAKHRNGPTGSVPLQFVRKTTRFVETEWRG